MLAAAPSALTLPETSVSRTEKKPVELPELAMSVCSAALLVTPRSNVAVVSVTPITESIATTVAAAPFGVKSNSALPPVTSPTTKPETVAVTLVFVVFIKPATTVPPTTVIIGAAGAAGASASTTIAAFVAKLPTAPAVTAGKVRTALLIAKS